ncbi:MAG TPA: ABC transporter ATP-binding protein [Anaerolineaceae bacterium]
MEPSIQAVDLTKRYHTARRPPAVDALSFHIPSGFLYGLVGPDGAGKTTTLRILATVIPQTSGSASLMGWDVRRDAEKIRSSIGYMPQNFSLYPDLSVIENLNFFARLHGVKGQVKQQRIDEMLGFTRLAEFTGRRAGNLSGGMKKKLALACALIHNPQVLILDEPSTGVDPVSRRELWAILARVVNQGVTVLVSTPYMDEAERCSEVGIIYQGRMLTSGTPDQLKSSLPYEIVEVKAKPRKTLRQAVQGTPDILAWRPVGDRLRLSVVNPVQVQQSLSNTLSAQNAVVRFIRRARVNMEDVFIQVADQRAQG